MFGIKRQKHTIKHKLTSGVLKKTSNRTLVAHNLIKVYRGRQVVDRVSFNIRSGETVGILGPNGAGKTTCFYMVTGLVKSDGGSIEIDGFDITRLP
ncbi:MAG: ATP-binding cassette domain-containing protein, partial [Bartonella sp.]|nr:ATP-binding cassette domain-containing protein [Bartonella sp.]